MSNSRLFDRSYELHRHMSIQDVTKSLENILQKKYATKLKIQSFAAFILLIGASYNIYHTFACDDNDKCKNHFLAASSLWIANLIAVGSLINSFISRRTAAISDCLRAPDQNILQDLSTDLNLGQIDFDKPLASFIDFLKIKTNESTLLLP